MVISGVTMPRGPRSRRRLVVAVVLAVAAVCGVALLKIHDRLPEFAAGMGISDQRPTAYTFIAGHIVRIDPSTGTVLAQSSDFSVDQFPSIAVSHDGQSLFVPHSEFQAGVFNDQLLILSTTTLTPQASVPLQHFMRSMESWPPAVAVTPDDRTVIISQYGMSDSDPYWISYYDRQTGRLAVDSTILRGCGVSQLLPFDAQVAVLCLGSDDVRFVDVQSHRVTATLTPFSVTPGVVGSAVAAGLIPGQQALAVVLNRGGLERIDLVTHAISLSANLVPPGDEFAPRWVDFSANGRAAVLLERVDGTEARPLPLLIVDTTSGRIIDRLSVDTLVGAITMSPDGRRVYVLAANGSLQEVDLATHHAKSFGPDPTRTWVHLVFADR